MKDSLKKLKAFHEIDFQFADFILRKENPATEHQDELYQAVLCLSFYANLQHSVLPIKEVDGQNFAEFCKSEQSTEINISFKNSADWLTLFPKSIGDINSKKPLIFEEEQGLLYLNKYYRAEEAIAQFIQSKAETQGLSENIQSSLNKLFPAEKCQYEQDWQKVAAFATLRNSFSVITGGPGTGKTTTVAKILTLLLEENPELKIDLLAPTGKAADRLGESILKAKKSNAQISQSIPEQASTIHRYLSYHGGSKEFRYNQQNKTNSDLLLVDEASMVSLPMFHHLIKALKDDCRIILLGDKDQLSAVETGNVLADLTAAEAINSFSAQFCADYQAITQLDFPFICPSPDSLSDCVVKLEDSYRFTADSAIGQVAKLINKADSSTKAQDFAKVFSKFDEIELKGLSAEFIDEIKAQSFFKSYKAQLANREEFSAQDILESLNTFRILCPNRGSIHGSEALNEMISREIFHKADQALYHGRCIMIRQNNKELGLYNGDVGVILVDLQGIPKVYFPGSNNSLREFSPLILPDFETAFAMTIHKSQGSEYNHVMIPLPMRESKFLSKELLYTGITRAKEQISLYSHPSRILEISQRKTLRYSGLNHRLKS
mgnify:CR=1 FL=1